MRELVFATLHRVPWSYWETVTWFGDSGLLLPISILILVWLMVSRETWPTAFAWALTFGVGSSLIVASKIAFLGWGIGSARFNFTGFSGHTAISASVWPVAFWLVTGRTSHWFRVTAALAGCVLAAAIGASRLALYAHSPSEVASGFVLGMLVSASFLLLAHRQVHPRISWPLVMLSFFLPLLFQQPGDKAPTQGLLERIAVDLAGIERPYTREDLLIRG